MYASQTGPKAGILYKDILLYRSTRKTEAHTVASDELDDLYVLLTGQATPVDCQALR
jgi:hypothetical protein